DVVLSADFEATADVLPVILTQPTSQVANVGDNVNFLSAALAGSSQWYFNGAPLPGETNPSLSRNNIKFSDVGVYFVRVSLGTRWGKREGGRCKINTAGDNAVARDKFADVVTDAGGFTPPGLVAVKSSLSHRIRKANVVRGYTGTQAFNIAPATKDPD